MPMNGKVAIVHDWLNGMRGGEKVLEQLVKIFPTADIFTLFLEEKKISTAIRAQRIHVSSLNRCAWVRNHYRYFLPFFPQAIESFNLQQYRLVISSSHCVAKGVIPAPDALHIAYIHSPMRYAWDQYYAYFGSSRKWQRRIINPLFSRLRTWDAASSARVDHFVANSDFVRQRIWKYYRREAEVIPPPVDIDFFQPAANPLREHFLLVSALVPYKNIEPVIAAFQKLPDEKLVIVGQGSAERRLRRLATPNVEFAGGVPPATLRDLYQRAAGLVFAGVEDFGIAFVEAQACSVPVIALRRGGVLDIVRDGETGLLFAEATPPVVAEAIRQCRRQSFAPAQIRENSLRFSTANFRQRLQRFVEDKIS